MIEAISCVDTKRSLCGYRTIALGIGGARNLTLGILQPKHIAALGTGSGLSGPAILSAIADLGARMPAAIAAIRTADTGAPKLKRDLIGLMEKRWKGSFASIGPLLSKRHGLGARRRT